MKKNARLWSCYYWDGWKLVEYKKIYYRDYLDYSERMFYKGFSVIQIGYSFYLFKNGCNAKDSYSMNLL